MRAIARIVLGLGLTASALAVVPGRANAHAVLLASSPAAGTSVTDSPAEVTLTFSEPVRLITLDVRDPQGRSVTAGRWWPSCGPVLLHGSVATRAAASPPAR